MANSDGSGSIQSTLSKNTVGDRVAQVAGDLEEKILSGVYQAGDVLPPERELSTDFGVSRSVVREALGQLGSLGLLERRQGAATRVAPPSNAPVMLGYDRLLRAGIFSLEQLTVARLPLEVSIVRLAAENRSEEHLAALDSQQAILGDVDQPREAHISADLEFHSILARASGNPVFEIVLAPIRQMRHEPYRRHYSLDIIQEAYREHGLILDAVRAADPDAADRAMREHLGKFVSNGSSAELAR